MGQVLSAGKEQKSESKDPVEQKVPLKSRLFRLRSKDGVSDDSIADSVAHSKRSASSTCSRTVRSQLSHTCCALLTTRCWFTAFTMVGASPGQVCREFSNLQMIDLEVCGGLRFP